MSGGQKRECRLILGATCSAIHQMGHSPLSTVRMIYYNPGHTTGNGVRRQIPVGLISAR